MDLKQLSYFMLICEEGSVSRAASKAGVVQPALSSQIRKLEKEFGVTLFVRTSRGVVPTDAGNILYDLALCVTQEIAETRQKIGELVQSKHVHGVIRVGLSPSLARGIFSPVMTKLAAEFPNIETGMVEGYSGNLTEWVRDGRIDFAIGAVPAESTGLRQRKLYRDNVVLISGKPIGGPQFTPCRLDQIANLKLIVPSRGHSFSEEVRRCIADGKIIVQSTVEIDGTSGGIELARSTDWSALCPFVGVHADVERNALFVYPIVSPSLTWDIFIIYNERRPLTPAGTRFIEAMERELHGLSKVWADFTVRYGAQAASLKGR